MAEGLPRSITTSSGAAVSLAAVTALAKLYEADVVVEVPRMEVLVRKAKEEMKDMVVAKAPEETHARRLGGDVLEDPARLKSGRQAPRERCQTLRLLEEDQNRFGGRRPSRSLRRFKIYL